MHVMPMRGRTAAVVTAVAGVAVMAGSASAQLRERDVLLVYDARIVNSLRVAEHYAGSARVPGGVGGKPGTRPNVRIFNLASAGALTPPAGGNIPYPDFITRMRTPIRNHLTAAGLAQRVRAIVTTKGLPHRILDTDVPTAGDFPGTFVTEITNDDATCASVEAELALLWQNLETGEAGGPADSKSDGLVLNPYWKGAQPVSGFTTANIFVPKTYAAGATGPVWQTTSGPIANRLTPGDIYLVCRLDGRDLADVYAMLDRSVNPVVDMNAAAILLDESDSNGIADATSSGELDDINGTFTSLRAGDDYEQTRDATQADGRFEAANIRYNAIAGVGQFFVGPRLAFTAGHGLLVTNPIALVGTYGSNHNGVPSLFVGGSAGTRYAESYNYSPGAVFNTIESFNCRDFEGLGQLAFAPQQQAADFLKAGGSFAVGNVWEPLADSIPDNRYLVQNFLLGNLSWGEAAWTSIPALSWAQIAIGDPLSRIVRSTEDLTGDGRVGVDDLVAWERGPTDINNSGVADAADRALLLRTMRQFERPDIINRR